MLASKIIKLLATGLKLFKKERFAQYPTMAESRRKHWKNNSKKICSCEEVAQKAIYLAVANASQYGQYRANMLIGYGFMIQFYNSVADYL